MAVGRRRINLSQDWTTLQVSQCRMFSPEIICTMLIMLIKIDSASCIYLNFYIQIYSYLYLCSNNNQIKKILCLIATCEGFVGGQLVRSGRRNRCRERDVTLFHWKSNKNTVHTRLFWRVHKKFLFCFLILYRCLKFRSFITGYYNYYKVLKTFNVLKILFCQ